ncbi:helix-turn-helix domain-containing protein [Kitasatospora sp. NBC_01287]|uniref:helix-turn-helix domain-containing protein n=1 Tax=Kitasatospora sp. NBC_01287 TaxID=2903573 RepID=UPI00224F7970|nr:helix-turn-helix domain-containing protein [Kitasatospora sp. NBC_01287]MCX4750884.1 helix-turn-helix domain-containing protein [Kitasatospora sp. NBC_01287]MCX4751843.1 helix-turn-helix domain-containing protein [Kitasatospora sp. NBC_01287]
MATITTTEAAHQAGVTIATIRHWCRYGAVTAAKVGRRWAIETASLTHRIALSIRRTRKAKPVTLTPERLVAIGGSRWQKNGKDRIYFNDWAQFAGLDISRYQSGGVNGASLGGRGIANGRIGAILASIDKVWFDVADGKFYAYENGSTELSIRYLNGDRDTINLFALVVAGIRAAATN